MCRGLPVQLSLPSWLPTQHDVAMATGVCCCCCEESCSARQGWVSKQACTCLCFNLAMVVTAAAYLKQALDWSLPSMSSCQTRLPACPCRPQGPPCFPHKMDSADAFAHCVTATRPVEVLWTMPKATRFLKSGNASVFHINLHSTRAWLMGWFSSTVAQSRNM